MAAGFQMPENQFDPDSIDIETVTQGAQQRARAAEQIARGKLAQRALSTTMIQLSQNLFANREEPLIRLARVAQERTDLQKVGRERIAAEQEGGLLRQTREVVGLTRATHPEESDMYKSLTISLADYDKRIQENAVQVADLTKKEEDQAESVVRLSKEAVGASDVLRNLAAGFAGGVAGSIVTMGVSMATQAVVAGMEKVVVPAFDRATGNNMTAQRMNQQLGAVALQSGFSQSAVIEQLVNAGFTQGQVTQLRGGLLPEAMGAGQAELTQQRLDLSLTAQANRRQQESMGLPPGTPPLYYRNQGAALQMTPGPLFDWAVNGQYMDIGGQDSVQKMFASELNNVIRNNPAQLAALNTRFGESGIRVRPGTAAEREADRPAMAERGAGDLFQALEGNNLVIEGLNNNVNRLDEAMRLFSSGTKDFGAILENEASRVSFQNQIAGVELSRQRSLDTAQMQSGLQGLGQPILPAGTGIPGGGSAAFVRQFQTMQSQVEAFEAQGQQMLKSLVPDDLVNAYGQLGETIADLGVEAGNIQATQAMRGYEMQVTQARYAVEDLLAITGRGEGSEIGRMERQNLLMQRRLQLLQFEQQQRRLNFGIAVAGFQSIGLTGEERAANLRIARKEARVGQQQLDISQNIFGNQVQIVDEQNLRQLRLAAMSLENVVQTFRENKRLGEIGQLVAVTSRRQRQLEEQIGINLQTELQLSAMQDQFIEQLATQTNTLMTSSDHYLTASDRFKQAARSVRQSVDALDKSGLLTSSQGDKGLPPINLTVNGTVVSYKTLVDKIIEEVGRMAGLVGLR